MQLIWIRPKIARRAQRVLLRIHLASSRLLLPTSLSSPSLTSSRYMTSTQHLHTAKKVENSCYQPARRQLLFLTRTRPSWRLLLSLSRLIDNQHRTSLYHPLLSWTRSRHRSTFSHFPRLSLTYCHLRPLPSNGDQSPLFPQRLPSSPTKLCSSLRRQRARPTLPPLKATLQQTLLRLLFRT